MHAFLVEDEPYVAEANRDGLSMDAIPADIAGDGGTALEPPRSRARDIADVIPRRHASDYRSEPTT